MRPSGVGMPYSRTPSGRPLRKRAASRVSCSSIWANAESRSPPPRLAQVVDRGGGARHRLVRLRARLEAVAGRVLLRRADAVRRQRLGQVGADRRDAEVRAEELVGRAERHVEAGLARAEPPVRREMHAVRPRERAHPVRRGGDASRVRDRADRVRGERERHHARPLAHQLLERVQVERHVLHPKRRGAHHEPVVLGHEQPGRDVRVVVERGHDDLVARLERPRDRVRELEVERGHVGPERDALRLAAHEVGRRGTGRAPSPRPIRARWLKAPPRFAFESRQVVRHRVDDSPGHLRAARAVEVRRTAGGAAPGSSARIASVLRGDHAGRSAGCRRAGSRATRSACRSGRAPRTPCRSRRSP